MHQGRAIDIVNEKNKKVIVDTYFPAGRKLRLLLDEHQLVALGLISLPYNKLRRVLISSQVIFEEKPTDCFQCVAWNNLMLR